MRESEIIVDESMTLALEAVGDFFTASAPAFDL